MRPRRRLLDILSDENGGIDDCSGANWAPNGRYRITPPVRRSWSSTRRHCSQFGFPPGPKDPPSASWSKAKPAESARGRCGKGGRSIRLIGTINSRNASRSTCDCHNAAPLRRPRWGETDAFGQQEPTLASLHGNRRSHNVFPAVQS